VIVVDVDSASLARVRLTPSPAYELVGWLMLAAQGRRHPVFGDPGPAARTALRDSRTALVAAVLPRAGRGYIPDLLTPQPPAGRRAHVLEAQLDAVAATPSDVVAQQLDWCAAERPLPGEVRAAAQAGTFASRVAAGMRAFWQATLADGWAALYGTLDADIRARSHRLAAYGVGDVLESLHPDLRWVDGRLVVRKPYLERLALRDDELVLAPSALRWPALSVQVCAPGNAVLCYPADGVGAAGAAAESAGRRRRRAVSALLGTTRGSLLCDLGEARSTGDLSTRHGLAAATVSHHLGVLLRAGLVHRTRDGRVVRYQRSASGDVLVGD
jgi:DNA-binding transcriptional ArsR family regulator